MSLPASLMSLDIDPQTIVADGQTVWGYVADAESTPMLLECGPDDGSVAMACIWRFDGSRLVLAFGREGYPTDFAVGTGRAAAVLTFSRDRSKPGDYGSPPVDPPTRADPPRPAPKAPPTVPSQDRPPPVVNQSPGGLFIPTPAEKTVFVKGHTRNGRWVAPHWRSPPRR